MGWGERANREREGRLEAERAARAVVTAVERVERVTPGRAGRKLGMGVRAKALPQKVRRAKEKLEAAMRRGESTQHLAPGTLVFAMTGRVYRVQADGSLRHAPEVPWEDPKTLGTAGHFGPGDVPGVEPVVDERGKPVPAKVGEDEVWP